MKKNLLLMIATFMAIQMAAAPVDQAQAMRVAKSFLTNEHFAGKMMAPAAVNPVLYKAEMGSTRAGQPVYYIFNTASTFVVVSGDDRAREILMVGDAPLDTRPIPDNMQYMLDCYKEEIEYLQARPGLVVEKGYYNNTTSLRATTYGPYLTANWDQSSPYYNDCVFTTVGGTQYQCLTGCAATSASMVMYYWKYPTEPTPTVPAYSFYLNDSYSSSMIVNVAALPSTTFQWANMRNSYTFGGTAAQKAAVANLMRYVGQAEKMEYGDADHGSGIPSSEPERVSNMFKLFGYDQSTTRAVRKSTYTQANWNQLIQNEMVGGRPVVYLAIATQGGGHAFNVDGYNGNSDTYHVNWGWSGYGNSWFAMNSFVDPDGYTFSQSQRAIVGIQPPGGQQTNPTLSVDPQSLDFGTVKTGKSVTMTFHVTGSDLLGDISFTRNGNASFSVSPETLTAAQVEAGADITVTYAPTAAGTHTCNIEVMGGAAAGIQVACTGVGQAAPAIVATPSELSFTTNVGEPVSATFNLKGYNLTKTTYISVQNAGGVFSVSKSNVNYATVNAGVDITVTYSPKSPGVKNARVMLRNAETDTIYVELTGTATVQKYDPVMLDPIADYITPSSFRADWTDETAAAAISSYTLEYYLAGQTHSSITGINEKYYTVTGLTPGSTYNYRVKSFYVDGTESAWSNVKAVTLPAGHAYAKGDVDHDGSIAISDASLLIDYLLGNANGICLICADVDGDGEVAVSDVTAIIDMLLQ